MWSADHCSCLSYVAVGEVCMQFHWETTVNNLPPLFVFLQLVFGCHLESRVEGDMEVGGCVQTDTSSCNKRATSVCGRGRPQSMKELSVTHRLVMTPHENEVEEGLYHFPVDGTPLAALTQVMFITSVSVLKREAPSMMMLLSWY